jgi:hypothetical protein
MTEKSIKVSNDVIDCIIKIDLFPVAWKVLWFIIQQNYFGCREFTIQSIAFNTDSHRSGVTKAINELLLRKIIFVEANKHRRIVTLNENLGEWIMAKEKQLTFELDDLETKKEEVSKEFFIYFNNYPKRIKFIKAKEAWKKLNPSPELAKTIIETVDKFKTSEEWKKNIGIPYPDTFIMHERWRDELTYAKKKWDEI